MPITDPHAVKFSNERLRVVADRLAQAYYASDAASDRWTSLGGGQPAIDVMEQDIREACDKIVSLYEFCFTTEKLWFTGLNATITNDAGEAIEDGATGTDGRPIVNGQDAHRLMDRVVQLQNWLLSAAGSFTDATRANAAYYNTVITAASDGPPVLSVASAGNAINRFDELTADYESSSNLNLNTVLAYAVNPGGGN